MSIKLIIGELSRDIFYKDKARLEKMLEVIFDKQVELGGSSNGFVYGSEFYTKYTKIDRKRPRDVLRPELHEQMRDYLFDLRKIQEDKQKIEQGLSAILVGCSTWQQVRDALPNDLARQFTQTRDLPRIQAEGFNLVNHARVQRQFKKTKDLIDIYLISRLMM
ncbi:hypothetical protein [Rhizobium phage RHph_X2_28B]|uniref:hypothetical protein n=1 Tax=Rhizobium phage RHph_X2_28B TaxID=2836086 RepID=UPI002329895E|nr:hypothetical protein PP751_gp056 [Rhizobium phage RHph_X2_28B]QWY83508.1 hypothetical protein [Rhizobium phage RHph_X2_28B]QWY83744.1 hypothetical protein [Rhizobium phage RHph_X3_15]